MYNNQLHTVSKTLLVDFWSFGVLGILSPKVRSLQNPFGECNLMVLWGLSYILQNSITIWLAGRKQCG